MVELRDVPTYKGMYKASSDGHIWSCYSEKWLKECLDKSGYLTVNLNRYGKKKKYYVHRLIAMTYINNIWGKPTVNHKNEIKTDNRVENLEWMTVLENIFYGTGQLRARLSINLHNEKISKRVKQLTADGKIVKIHKSINSAARALGVDKNDIKRCLKDEGYTCHGFKWQLA